MALCVRVVNAARCVARALTSRVRGISTTRHTVPRWPVAHCGSDSESCPCLDNPVYSLVERCEDGGEGWSPLTPGADVRVGGDARGGGDGDVDGGDDDDDDGRLCGVQEDMFGAAVAMARQSSAPAKGVVSAGGTAASASEDAGGACPFGAGAVLPCGLCVKRLFCAVRYSAVQCL